MKTLYQFHKFTKKKTMLHQQIDIIKITLQLKKETFNACQYVQEIFICYILYNFLQQLIIGILQE